VHLGGAKSRSDRRKQPASRPDNVTEDLTAGLERLLRSGNYIEIACQVVGLGRSTFNDWMTKGLRDEPRFAPYRVFRQRIEAAMSSGEATRVAQIAKAASGDDGDWRAAAWMLERQAPERWAKPSQRAHAESEQARDREQVPNEATQPLRSLLETVRAQGQSPGKG